MDALGIDVSAFIIQFFVIIFFAGLPILTLIDLSRKKLTGTPLAIWVLIICIIPIIGSIAYWIVKPTVESNA